MNVHQFSTSLTYGDAISNEMMEIRGMLREQGYTSEIFTRFFDPRMAGDRRDYREYDALSSSDNVAIFHFSIGSPVSKLFFRIPDKKIMIYHNITPYEFFLDSHRILARECYKGRLELNLFVGKADLALGDSEYNRRELERAGYPRTGVLPLPLNFTPFDEPGDPAVHAVFPEERFTLLFVGRVIPNKKFEDVLKAFAVFKRHFHPEARLILAGDYRGQERYFSGLNELVHRLNLDQVTFTGHVNFSELLAYFEMADVYLSMSEHEGFGVPLLEAFYKRIPVVAFAAGAVEETLNGGGVLLRSKRFSEIAALLDRIRTDAGFRDRIIEGQLRALKKYDREGISRILLDHIRKVSS